MCFAIEEDGKNQMRSHECLQCSQSFSDLTQLQEHLKTDCVWPDSRAFDTSSDGASQPNQTELGPPKDGRHAGAFQCDKCPRSYDTEPQLLRHVSYHNKQHDDVFHCSRCSRFFCSSATWRKHQSIHRRFDACTTPESEAAKTVYTCSRCVRTFDCRMMLARHEKSHDETEKRRKRRFVCSRCSRSFSSRAVLDKHKMSHADKTDDNKTVHCHFCNKGFFYQSLLYRHIKAVHYREGLSELRRSSGDEDETMHDYNADADASGDRSQSVHVSKMKTPSPVKKEEPADVFQCDKCPRSFDARLKLQRHLAYHNKHRDQVFYCYRCSQSFCSLSTWKRHEQIHRQFDACKTPESGNSKTTYACTRCERTFDCRFMLARHETNHKSSEKRKSRVFRCTRCSRSFCTSARLAAHEMAHNEHDDSDYSHKCQFCDKRFVYESVMFAHMEKMHSNEDLSKVGPVHVCTQCSAVFLEPQRLRSHEASMHYNAENPDASAVQSSASDRVYSCDQCSKTYKSRVGLTVHLNTHADLLPYVCRTGCNRRFAQAGTRCYHERTHSDATPHLCAVCGLAFKRAVNLRLHARLHAGIFPHKCPYCPKAYHKSCQLLQHVRVHTREQPYVCTVCSKRFSLRTQLVRHDRAVHRRLKPWQCSVCDKSFSQPGNLRIHMRVHTREKPFVCFYCNSHFSYAGSLKSHMQKHEQM